MMTCMSGSVALCETAFAAAVIRSRTRTLVITAPAGPCVPSLPLSVLTGFPDYAG